MSAFTTINFQPGEQIFCIGDSADHLYVIQQGVVEFLNSENTAFAKASAGESFGEQAFLTGGIRGATAKALTPVQCLQISAEHANSLLEGASPLLIPVFEALLLQQNMHNALKF